METKSSSLSQAFRHAGAGIAHALRSQRNIRIHFVIAALVIVAGVVLRVQRVQWAALILVIVLVIALELVNTAIEAAVDLLSPSQHPLAKVAKDCAAAAVLVAALGALAVGVLVFLP